MLRTFLLTFALALSAVAADVPRQLPAGSFQTATGPNVDLAKFRGKALVVEFLSTICEHCQRTSMRLEKLYQELGPRGLQVVGVATNPGASTLVWEFTKSFGVTFPVAYTDDLKMRDFLDMSPTEIPYVPHTLFVDRQGVIRDEHVGELTDKELRAKVESLLKAGPAPAPKAAPKTTP